MKRIILSLALLLGTIIALPAQGLPQLRVSDNGHFLQYIDGTPFFYQGDTAWELFHRLTREEADRYLQNRADKGYNLSLIHI